MENGALRKKRYQQEPISLDDGEYETLAKLRIEVEANKNLYCPVDDEFLIRFLRAKKHNVDNAHKMIEKFLRVKADFEDVFEVPYKSIQEIYNTDCIKVLKQRTEKGVQLFYMNYSAMDPERLTLNEIRLAFFLILEEITHLKETQKHGCCLILDFGNLTFAQVKHVATFFNVKQIKLIAKCLQGTYPIRIKGIYFLNLHFFLSSLFQLLKLLLTEKLRNRIFTGSIEVLKNNFNPSILPVSLGGTAPDDEAIDFELQQRALKNYSNFKDFVKYGYIPTKKK